MNSIVAWRAGAVLVLVSGALVGIGLPASAVPLLAVVRLGQALVVADLLLGLGLVLAGVGIRRRYPACWLLMVAGGAWLLSALVGLVGDVVVGMPGWADGVLVVLVAVTMLAAAVGVLLRGRLPGPARWILLLAAIGAVAVAVTRLVPTASAAISPVLMVAQLLPVVVGIVWLTVRDEPAPASAAAMTGA